jgi:hypothetical protein
VSQRPLLPLSLWPLDGQLVGQILQGPYSFVRTFKRAAGGYGPRFNDEPSLVI